MSKGMVAVVAAMMVAVMAGSVYAGCGSCPGDKPKAKSAACAVSKGCGCYSEAKLADLNLTSTQKKRIEAAKSACQKKIESILTADQKKKLEGAAAPAKCGAPARKGCR